MIGVRLDVLQGHRDAHEIARVEHCTQPKRRGRAPATLMRRDWQPSADVVAAFACEGVDAAACVPEFLDYWLGEGKPKADWDATFRNRVRQRIEQAGAGGGLLLSPSHALAPEVPLENIAAMFRAAQRYGQRRRTEGPVAP